MSWPIAPFLKVSVFRDPLLLFCSGFSGPGPENEFVVMHARAAEPPVPVRIRIVGPCTVYTNKYRFYPLRALWMCSYVCELQLEA